jgi:hypothetical protein
MAKQNMWNFGKKTPLTHQKNQMLYQAFLVHHNSKRNLCGVHLQLVLLFLSLDIFHKGAIASISPSLSFAILPIDILSTYLQHSPS